MNHPASPRSHISPRYEALAAAMLLLVGLTALAALGHDGRRIAQVVALALPVVAWMLWPLPSPALNHLRSAIVWLWVVVFAVGGAGRAYLRDAYQAAPDSAMVLGAIANTNARESA